MTNLRIQISFGQYSSIQKFVSSRKTIAEIHKVRQSAARKGLTAVPQHQPICHASEELHRRPSKVIMQNLRLNFSPDTLASESALIRYTMLPLR